MRSAAAMAMAAAKVPMAQATSMIVLAGPRGISRPVRSATGSAAGSPVRCAHCRPGPGGR
jgi:hypothetical protein